MESRLAVLQDWGGGHDEVGGYRNAAGRILVPMEMFSVLEGIALSTLDVI